MNKSRIIAVLAASLVIATTGLFLMTNQSNGQNDLVTELDWALLEHRLNGTDSSIMIVTDIVLKFIPIGTSIEIAKQTIETSALENNTKFEWVIANAKAIPDGFDATYVAHVRSPTSHNPLAYYVFEIALDVKAGRVGAIFAMIKDI